MDRLKKCACCGATITSGYVWDNLDSFCSRECLVKVFNGDEGCADILIEEGERIQWVGSLD